MSIKVLIADDHEVVRYGLQLTLSQFSEIELVAEAFDGATLPSNHRGMA